MRKPQPLADASAARQRLQAIHRDMGALLPALLERAPMFAACVYYAPRRCGNAGCHCAQGEPHPAWLMSYKEKGRMVNRSVPAEERERLISEAENYRRFRRACRTWRKLSREAQEVFEVLQQARTMERRKVSKR